MRQGRNKKLSQPGRAGNRRLSAILAGGGLLLVIIAAYIIWQGRQPDTGDQPRVSGAPALVITPQQIDMGEIKLGDWVTAKFELSNLGDQPLQMTDNPYVELVDGC